MDCDKFDQHVIDALYDELDELTYAALKRHVEGCSRCAGVWAGLRATREVGVLPLVQPPDDLEARVLEAVADAQRRAPWHRKVLRGLAWAGSHAMRPQLAMAALFFLVLGSSVLVLRAKPGTVSPLSVSEHGAPTPDREVAAAAPAAPAATASPAVAGGAPVEAVAAASAAGPRARAGDEAPADKALAKGSADDARAALAAARAARDGAGCASAVAKLDAVAVTYAGTQAAADAMWDEATCLKEMGQTTRAQQIYLALRSTGYRDRAEQQLAADGASNANVQNNAVAARAPAAAPPPAAALPSADATAAPSAVAEAARAQRAAGAAGAKAAAAPRPAPYGATNPRAPAAPAKRAIDSNAGF
jgi:hypothetical protein